MSDRVARSDQVEGYRLRTIPEVAERAGCHRKTVERAIQAGRLAALNIGKPGARRPEIRIRPEDEEAWLEGCLVRPRRPASLRADAIGRIGPDPRTMSRLQVAEGMGCD
jgi:excisionase family DNA binding protein